MRVTAPGKLMLSGEWSVLEIGIPCIVMAIDQRVGVEINPSEGIILNAPDLGLQAIGADFDGSHLSWKTRLDEKQVEKLAISKNAIEITLQYLKAKRKKTVNFRIDTFSKDALAKLPDGSTAKVGFGSSAAVCVAIVAAILGLHGFNLEEKKTKDIVFKIACTAHYLAQGKVGSSFDIAAATYGGTLVYIRFDPDWLVREMNSGENLAEIMDHNWPSLHIENIQPPKDFRLLVGFVGYSASTKELIAKLNAFKVDGKEYYWRIIEAIKGITKNLVEAIKEGDKMEIISLLKDNRRQLQELSESSRNNLETQELSRLADIAENEGAAGKFSGAGGGDCGIAVCFDEKTAGNIRAKWIEGGIIPLDVKISEKGVMVE